MDHQLEQIECNLALVNANIQKAFHGIVSNTNKFPTLVAVSKIQQKEFIIEAYRCGQRHFGENYIQELYDKANDVEVMEKCPEIKWHMIGHIQSNKINKLLAIPNLFAIQTVDSIKLAGSLNYAIERSGNAGEKINVFVQVNTSNEAAKSGIDFAQVEDLVKFILNNCNFLNFTGLMTIGVYGFDCSSGPNPDFLKLLEVRDYVCSKLNISKSEVELSMGMSADYEHAISLGSTVVRVGTGIFGERPKKA